MSESSDDVGAFLAGFVVGALVGAAAALILAPQAGEDTRSVLAQHGESWRSVGSERLAQVGSALSEARTRAGDGEVPGQALPRILLNRAKDQQTEGDASEQDEAADTNGTGGDSEVA